MAFDSKRFAKEKFEPRTESVSVPSLAPWFGEGDEAVWVIRGLEGAQMARMNEAVKSRHSLSDLASAMAAAAGSKEKIGAILEAAGFPSDVKAQPEDMVRRLELLVAGSVEPACDLPLAIKLAKAFPVEFFDLTSRIIVLTGLGHQPGKPKPSGATPASEPQ